MSELERGVWCVEHDAEGYDDVDVWRCMVGNEVLAVRWAR